MDLGIGISGMYYGQDVEKLRKVKASGDVFILAEQYQGNPATPPASLQYYYMGKVVAGSIPIDATGDLVMTSQFNLMQREPLVRGTSIRTLNQHAPTLPYTGSAWGWSNSHVSINFDDHDIEELAFLWDLRGVEGEITTPAVPGSGGNPGTPAVRATPEIRMTLFNGANVVGNWVYMTINIDDVSRPNMGMVKPAVHGMDIFHKGSSVPASGAGSYPDNTWPTSGTWQLKLQARHVESGTLDMRLGSAIIQITE